MLCFEGIAMNLNIFNGKSSTPNFRVVAPPDGVAHEITVTEEVCFSTTEPRE